MFVITLSYAYEVISTKTHVETYNKIGHH